MNSFKKHRLSFALLIIVSLFLCVFAGCNSRKSAELLNSELRSAACKGKVNKIEYLLNRGADVNAEGKDGKTALYDAVVNEKWDAALYLVKRGANVKPIKFEEKDFDGVKLMHEFAVHEDWKLVQLLIEMGINVHSEYEYNYRNESVLCSAAESGNLEMVKWLVEHDADIYEDEYVLRYAAQSGNLELVQWLVEKGLDVNNDNEVLCYAAQSGNLELVKWLVEKGLDVNYEIYGKSVLHCAVESGNLELVKWLVENGADVKKIANKYSVLINCSISHGNLEMIKWLVENGADVKKYIKDNYDVLESAIRSGNPEMVKYLNEHGLVVKTSIYRDEINAAVRSGNPEMVKYLVENDADVKLIDLSEDVLERFLSSGNMEMVKCLVELGVDVIKEINNGRYIVIGHEVFFHWLVEHGAKFNEINSYLFEFVKEGNLENVKWLIAHGADVNAKDIVGMTALHYAVENWDLNMVKILIERGADVNAKDKYSQTALYDAASEGNLEIVQWLIEHGADVNANRKDGNAALCNAVNEGNQGIVQLIFDYGVDSITKINYENLTPLHQAACNKNWDIAQCLIEHGANPSSHIWIFPYWFELLLFEGCSDYSFLSCVMFHDILFVTIVSFLLLTFIASIYVLIKKRYKSSLTSDAKSKP